MTDLWRLGARDLGARIARREVSPVEVMREVLGRIEAANGPVNAIVSLRDREALMGEARLAEAMAPEGWLHGVPVAIKDLVDVRGVRSTRGSPILKDHVPLADDGLARRLRAAGAIVIGKTNVPAFGLGSHTVNPVFGATRNPYDLSRSAGGSSGGAAVALALRMLPVADGSDMMGSLRNPAAWNNVYGFRPTAGLVPGEARDGVVQHRLSTDGPMARDIDDLEALLGTLSDGAYRPGSGKLPRRPRIGWLGNWGGAYAMEPGLVTQSEAALRVMESLGWAVEPVAPPFPAAALWEAWVTLRQFAVAMNLGPYWRVEAHQALLPAQAKWEVSHGFALKVAEVEWAAETRLAWRAAAREIFARFDAVVLPSTQVWPFAVEARWPETIDGTVMDTYHRWMEVVAPASLGGLPALALPAGFGAEGLPAGVQLIGAPGADAALMALGQAYHVATDWPDKHPPPGMI
ncbi:amidase [Roseicyclus mahoneyensis]|uniref:Amidase n=1 Tax=Roseicyclus mahoneyensis TaxID=164332 RepID=A0A316GMK9_9RHOB|nr:amidase [Roseicyclus mahoneyensis]PWK62245.1 amidase [Roseicyclus mahoneyensis]